MAIVRRSVRWLAALGALALLIILPATAAETTDGCCTALLIIDVQNAFATDPIWHTTIDGVFIVDKVVHLLDLAHTAGVPVIYIKDVSERDTRTEDDLAFPEAIAPQDDEWIVEKKMQDAFAFTDLDECLAQAGITQLLISGLASQACVDTTALGALRRGYEVIMIADGHTGRMKGETATEYNARWETRGIPVIPSEELDWSSLCAAATDTQE